jgi:hypothetical protein
MLRKENGAQPGLLANRLVMNHVELGEPRGEFAGAAYSGDVRNCQAVDGARELRNSAPEGSRVIGAASRAERARWEAWRAEWTHLGARQGGVSPAPEVASWAGQARLGSELSPAD